MILRRFAEALKQQNWSAVAIEFVLLVLGVFLGIQVANWNETRREHTLEAEYIDEVSESRLLGGVHYRFSVDAGRDAGIAIGKLAVERYFKPVVAGR